MTNKQIEWRKIPGFESYSVSTTGKILSNRNKTPRILKPDIDKDGYEIVRLSNDFGRKALKVHRAVAITFLEPVPDKDLVNHKDGIKSNNNLSNLEWVSNSENIRHALDMGLLKVYTKGIMVTDTISNTIVGYYHGYETLVELTNLSKLTLIDIVFNKSLLYGAYRIERYNSVDYSTYELFNARFIKRSISQRKRPLRWGNDLYASGKEFQKENNVSSRKFKKLIELGFYNDKPIYHITQYEYVNF